MNGKKPFNKNKRPFLSPVTKPQPRFFSFLFKGFFFLLIIALFVSAYLFFQEFKKREQYQLSTESLQINLAETQQKLQKTESELLALQNVDQKLRNDDLEKRLIELKKIYAAAVDAYEEILKLEELDADTKELEEGLALLFNQLAKDQLAESQESIVALNKEIAALQAKLREAAALAIPKVVQTSNQPPASGYSRQAVETDAGKLVVSMVAADLSSTRVIVDTASDSDCANNCPVLSVGEYVSRSGGYAGINGTYFCPESYPSCAGKTNSFDLLVMNKNKVYFNSANNVYSTNPAVIFSGGGIRFVGAAQEWGRDTGVDGVLSNYPLLLSSGEVRFGGDDDPKKGSKGNRSFVANKGNTVYIGVVHGATVAESARAMKALGMDNALNLDSGGSTALWSGGYVVGPGRNVPNAIVFVRK